MLTDEPTEGKKCRTEAQSVSGSGDMEEHDSVAGDGAAGGAQQSGELRPRGGHASGEREPEKPLRLELH